MTYVEAAGLMPAGLGKPEGLGKEDDLLPAAGLTAASARVGCALLVRAGPERGA